MDIAYEEFLRRLNQQPDPDEFLRSRGVVPLNNPFSTKDAHFTSEAENPEIYSVLRDLGFTIHTGADVSIRS